MNHAQDAIARSTSHSEVVHLEANPEALVELLALCDGYVHTGHSHDMWGKDDEGSEWRVVMALTSL